jgi:hypothetical protein
MTGYGCDDDRSSRAQEILDAVDRRSARGEAVGILRQWHRCGTAQARQDLSDGDLAERDAAASRAVEITDGDADPCADPDWR